MLTSFERVDTLLANELVHQVTFPMPPALATLITAEMGDASFHSKLTTAWYGRAHLGEVNTPFVVRCDPYGNWTGLVPHAKLDDFSDALANVCPGIEIVEPRGRMYRAA